MIKKGSFFFLVSDPACPSTSPSSPTALCCNAQLAEWPDTCPIPSDSLAVSPVRIVSIHIIRSRTEAEINFSEGKWMEEVFELGWNVIYDVLEVQQICSFSLELPTCSQKTEEHSNSRNESVSDILLSTVGVG